MPRLDLGVAIALPPPVSAELSDWRDRLGDPEARRMPPHVTLLPPTALPVEALDPVLAHLTGVAARARPFALRLHGTATFRPVSPVVFVAVEDGAEHCGALQEQVRTGPLAREVAFPYHPHVTVAHDLAEAALDVAQTVLADYEAAFEVEAFALWERGPDKVWRPRQEFPLGRVG